MDTIQEEVDRRYDMTNGDVFGVFLSGSQLYKLADEQSDIDTKTYVFPSLASIAKGDRPKSKEIVMEDSESHNVVKDVRLLVPMLAKQHPAFVENLYSKWCHVNPDYADYWNTLVDNASAISHIDERRTCLACFGTLQNKDMRVRKSAEKGEVDGKALAGVLQMYYFIYHYIKGCGYEQCMVPSDYERLLQIKRHGAEEFSPDEALKISTSNREKAIDLITNHEFNPVDEKTLDWLNNFMLNLVERYLRDKLN